MLGRIVGCEGRCAAGRLHRYIDGNAGWMLEKARSGGGPMYNLGVHWIDLYRWLLDDEVVEVVGKNVKVNEQYDIEDNSFALLTFSRGAVVALDISYTVPDSYPYGRDLVPGAARHRRRALLEPVVRRRARRPCSCAATRASSPRRRAATSSSSCSRTRATPGSWASSSWRTWRERSAAAARPPITGEDGVRALEVVEAIYKSAAERKGGREL